MSSFPPLPAGDAPAIHLQTAQGQQPPVPTSRLKELLQRGELPRDTALWFHGLPGWIRAADHPELQAVLPAGSPDDEMDRVFGGLVKESWAYFREHEKAGHIDEVLVGAIITATLDNQYSLIDLSSNGNNHYLRFENIQGDQSRVVFQLAHLTPGLTAAKVLGQRMSVVVGYGERMPDFGRVWQAIKAEFKSGY
ncbi:MAG: DUF4339 domain-containing protein, partial [Polyangiaceae bacterium]|nr:DUF4339 domain-containing protein [Polyangiaceae bacterium]